MDGNWQTGDWNIAHKSDAWELVFNELPDDNMGIEWEPCQLIDPISHVAASNFSAHFSLYFDGGAQD